MVVKAVQPMTSTIEIRAMQPKTSLIKIQTVQSKTLINNFDLGYAAKDFSLIINYIIAYRNTCFFGAGLYRASLGYRLGPILDRRL